MSQQFYQTYVPNPFIPTFNPTINSSRIDYPSTNSAKQADIKESSNDQIQQNNVITSSFSLNPQTNKSIVLKPILTNQDEYQRKINDLEKSHKKELRDLEFKMQQQLDSLLQKRQQDDQFKQLTDVRQQIAELQSSLYGNTYGNPYSQQQQQQHLFYSQNELDRLEKQLKKKKNKIKLFKTEMDSLKSELQLRQQKITELEIKLHYSENKPIIQQTPLPKVITVPQSIPQPTTIIQDSPELIDRIRSLEFERDSLLQELRRFQSTFLPVQKQQQYAFPSVDEWNRLMHEYKVLENENNKLNTIILQKDDLIKSLEQRISVELTKQSALQAQGHQPRAISVLYDPQAQQSSSKSQQLYPIAVQNTEQQSNIEPTLQNPNAQ
ncbi:unnamed protein product [Paramecium primaurelia]|uniref:Uncharacterized protein n=1 Tax=Paramecium primaurelia TaxID=5886 RepID=A0A8S1MTA6_PARPR|nr:unnamed protein product [Paramecium primaurelia]